MLRLRLLLATSNPGKIREIRPILQDIPARLLTLADLDPVEEPAETGATFADNARLKALYYAAAFGLPTVAEDSGLEIEALGGRPGVHSARYPGRTYPDKFRNLYAELAGHPRPWTARYLCAAAVVRVSQGSPAGPRRPDVAFECLGTVDGEIWPEPLGKNGFGYDPIFYYPPYRATFGQVDDARKLEVAHRGRAFRQVREWVVRG